MKIVDLTIPVKTGMEVYPNDPEVVISDASEGKKGKCNISRICMGSHTGTHIDMPYHFIKQGKRLKEFPLEGCMGPGVVVHKPAEPGEILSFCEEELAKILPGSVLLIHTGWQARRGGLDYFTSVPALSEEAVAQAMERGVKAFGFDTPSVDNPATNCRIHQKILGNGLAIVEALANLEQLTEPFFFCAAPLLIADEAGGDGSPVRAFALLE